MSTTTLVPVSCIESLIPESVRAEYTAKMLSHRMRFREMEEDWLPSTLLQFARWRGIRLLNVFPRIEKVYSMFGSSRASIHRLLHTTAGTLHSHFDDLGVRVLSGGYEMDVGLRSATSKHPHILGRKQIHPGHYYDMPVSVSHAVHKYCCAETISIVLSSTENFDEFAPGSYEEMDPGDVENLLVQSHALLSERIPREWRVVTGPSNPLEVVAI